MQPDPPKKGHAITFNKNKISKEQTYIVCFFHRTNVYVQMQNVQIHWSIDPCVGRVASFEWRLHLRMRANSRFHKLEL